MRFFLTLAVFALTLALMLTRPRGLHEAWATCLGGGLMLLLGLETPAQAWRTTAQGGDVLAFLLALMLLSGLLDRSGFFEWAAIHAARAAKGDGKALYRNVFLLGAVVTALLSLDTTAIILTPVVLAFVGRLKLKARPFLLACAFVANTASLLLPVSNLTNLLFQKAFHLSFGAFALRMASRRSSRWPSTTSSSGGCSERSYRTRLRRANCRSRGASCRTGRTFAGRSLSWRAFWSATSSGRSGASRRTWSPWEGAPCWPPGAWRVVRFAGTYCETSRGRCSRSWSACSSSSGAWRTWG